MPETVLPTEPEPQPAGDSTPSADRPAAPTRKWLWIAFILVVAAYANALRGGFVYDDQLEIVRNPYIQDPSLFWKAMFSDVWAFRGSVGDARSNYWRPVFVAWMAGNYRLFGLQPLGWHVTNLLAHVAVVALLWRLLGRLRVGAGVQAAVTCLFAVHPSHSESVAWPSGIPNMLHAAFLLAAVDAWLKARESATLRRWVMAVALYVAALLSKEGAVVAPALLLAFEWASRAPDAPHAPRPWRSALMSSLPFAAAAAAFLLARHQVLRIFRIVIPGVPGLLGVLATAPAVICFYLLLAAWPINLGIIYESPVAVTNANMAWANFWLPVVFLCALGVLFQRFLMHRYLARLGLAWFLLTIAPVVDIRGFPPGQIVHDRYLYLPLIGILLMICAAAKELVLRFGNRPSLARAPAVSTAIVCCLFVVLTFRNNRAWVSDIALWERGEQVAPGSPFVLHELGEAYRQAGRLAEARVRLEKSIEIMPDLTGANLALGTLEIQEGNYSAGRALLTRIVQVHPQVAMATEQLAVSYQREGRLDEAIRTFEEGRLRCPWMHDAFTINIAVLEYQARRPTAAMDVLESVRHKLEVSNDPAIYRGLWYLGELRRSAGDRAGAAAAYSQFLARSSRSSDPQVLTMRNSAEYALRSLRASP